MRKIGRSTSCDLVVFLTAVYILVNPIMSSGADNGDWEQKFLDHVTAVEKLHVEYIVLRKELEREGFERDLDDEEFLKWLGSATKEQVERQGHLVKLDRIIRKGLLDLWREVGDPVILSSVSRNRLVDEAPKITEAYRRLIREHENDDLPDIVRAAIPKIIESLDSDYAWEAMLVLERCIEFDDAVIVTHAGEVVFQPTLETRDKLYRAMKRWYKRKADSLVWNTKFEKFEITLGSVKLPIAWDKLDWH